MGNLMIFICCFALILPACKKDKKSKTRTELLTSGSWHVTAYTVDPAIDWDGDGTEESNVYAIMEQCIKDDRTTFTADGKGELDEGATRCNSNDPQVTPLVWSFDQSEELLKVQGTDYIIESLTESQLIVKDIQVISAVTVTHTVTFSH